jgi:hypothetical protein
MFIEKRRMGRADKAVLRLAIGLGLAVLVAYGLALKAPYAVCVVAVLILCKPGPPIPLFKGMALALVIAVLMMAGVLMVPVLESYALTGVLLTGALLYAVFYSGVRHANPLATILVMAITLIPVVGVVEQVLALQIGDPRGGPLHRRAGQRHLARSLPRSPRARRQKDAAEVPTRSPRAGLPCAPSWSSCRSSCWR